MIFQHFQNFIFSLHNPTNKSSKSKKARSSIIISCLSDVGLSQHLNSKKGPLIKKRRLTPVRIFIPFKTGSKIYVYKVYKL